MCHILVVLVTLSFSSPHSCTPLSSASLTMPLSASAHADLSSTVNVALVARIQALEGENYTLPETCSNWESCIPYRTDSRK